jgi:drug/metabolite transporter (DMT)-like permease
MTAENGIQGIYKLNFHSFGTVFPYLSSFTKEDPKIAYLAIRAGLWKGGVYIATGSFLIAVGAGLLTAAFLLTSAANAILLFALLPLWAALFGWYYNIRSEFLCFLIAKSIMFSTTFAGYS